MVKSRLRRSVGSGSSDGFLTDKQFGKVTYNGIDKDVKFNSMGWRVLF